MNELPKRKNARLENYDYSRAGYYFVTICTQGRASVLRRGAQCAPANGGLPPLTEIGHAAENALLEIPHHYDNVSVDKYVIMPNHVHAVLVFAEGVGDGRTMCAPTKGVIEIPGSGPGGRTMCAPTLSRVIKAWKETVTKQIGRSIWQKGYYDHVIRNEADHLRIWQYIDDNPAKWAEDEYYSEQ